MQLAVIILLVLVAFWLGKEFSTARRQQAFRATRDARGRPILPPHQRADGPAVEDRVAFLRKAVARGDVTLDEAAGSLIRFAGGAISTNQAREMLGGR